jgi:hypothetical protein
VLAERAQGKIDHGTVAVNTRFCYGARRRLGSAEKGEDG